MLKFNKLQSTIFLNNTNKHFNSVLYLQFLDLCKTMGNLDMACYLNFSTAMLDVSSHLL